MKNNRKRRNFIKGSLLVSTGAMLLPTSNLWATKSISFNTKSYADIRTNLFGKQVEVSGQIFDAAGQKPLENVTIEFWHLSPKSKQMGHRGTLTTNTDGNYHIKTDFPSKVPGKSAILHFKISKGSESVSTELKISKFGADISGKHWEQNHQLGNDLLFPKFEKSLFRTKINFNFSFNTN